MFCADYIASFIFHAGFTAGLAHLLIGKGSTAGATTYSTTIVDWVRASTGLQQGAAPPGEDDARRVHAAPAMPFVFGAAAGLCGGIAVFPFDFVRAAVTPAGMPWGRQLLRNLSSVPYSAAFFGVYFAGRTPRDIKSQAGWALLASSCAVLAEAPFDQAKRALFQNRRLMLGANALYAPFAAMMLVGYDNVVTKVVMGGSE
jgi:hypothetical protein